MSDSRKTEAITLSATFSDFLSLDGSPVEPHLADLDDKGAERLIPKNSEPKAKASSSAHSAEIVTAACSVAAERLAEGAVASEPENVKPDES